MPFEVRQSHELAGMIAVQAKQWDVALAELGKAGDQNPRVIYFTGLAWQGKGDAAKASEAFRAAADFNQLSGVYGFIQPEATPAARAGAERPRPVPGSRAGRSGERARDAQGFSIGAPIRLPYSVQLPS